MFVFPVIPVNKPVAPVVPTPFHQLVLVPRVAAVVDMAGIVVQVAAGTVVVVVAVGQVVLVGQVVTPGKAVELAASGRTWERIRMLGDLFNVTM